MERTIAEAIGKGYLFAMPELPEVETVRRGLATVLDGARLSNVVLRRRTLRVPIPDDFEARLVGQRIVRLGRRAKYLLIELEDGTIVIAHLGMSGRMKIHRGEPGEPGPHDHADFVTEAGVTVRFTDPRRFGLLLLTTVAEIDEHKLIRDLGPDPLGNDFNAVVLAQALAGRATPLKAALLDQKTVAGLGNIYVCESLFRAGLSPKRLARTLTPKHAEALAAAIRTVLADAVAAGGTTLRDHISPDGELGYFTQSLTVYGREGEACPGCDCKKTIRRIVQSGRSTFYCPSRQR
jgi:formamidopyrimidine-DNA glycosylase